MFLSLHHHVDESDQSGNSWRFNAGSASAQRPDGQRDKTVKVVFCWGTNPAVMETRITRFPLKHRPWSGRYPRAGVTLERALPWRGRYLGVGMRAVHVLGTKNLNVDAAEILQLHLSKDSLHPVKTEAFRRWRCEDRWRCGQLSVAQTHRSMMLLAVRRAFWTARGPTSGQTAVALKPST